MKRISVFSMVLCLLAINIYAQQSSNNVLSVQRNQIDNTIVNIIFSQNANLPLDNSATILREYLQLNDPDNVLIEGKTTNPYPGIVSKRYQQWYKGIKVEHGAYTLMARNGIIRFIHGSVFKPETSLSVTTTLTEAQALQVALDYTNAQTYMWDDADAEKLLKELKKDPNATYKPTAIKVWVEDFSNGKTNRKLNLAYRFTIDARQPLSSKKIYIDANTGKILMTDDNIKHATATGKSLYSGTVSFETSFSGGNYILMDGTRGSGVYTGSYNNTTTTQNDVTNPNITWDASPAIDAHWGATKVYDYWKNNHNRLSFDDMNSMLASFVSYGVNYNNAFWNGSFMTYGDGSGIINGGTEKYVPIEVCGHEIGHGVCQYTANLVYQSEPGAMNEGFSDIWGSTIKQLVAPEKPRWQHNPEIRNRPSRIISHPKLGSSNQPDTYNGINWYPTTPPCNSGNDYCGVHINSGVLNKWYYLIVDGDTGTNDAATQYTVGGIGLHKAAQIAYATELSLAPTDDYATCRIASIAAATTLFGDCTPEVEAVKRAWNAVNVGPAFSACGPQIAFVRHDTTVAMDPLSANCPSSVTLDIPITVTAAPTGGSPVITIVDSGSAIPGVDYTIGATTFTFPKDSITTKVLKVTILNHAAITSDKKLVIKFNLAANGSDAVAGNLYQEYHLLIKNKNKAIQTSPYADYTPASKNIYTMIASPFFSAMQSARSQFIISAADLLASDLKPNTVITHFNVNVVDKKSTRPFTGYTIKLGLTTQSSYVAGVYIGPLTTVYTGNYTTTAGWNKIPLSVPFYWDGTSNIVCEVCFGNATASSDATDRVDATVTNFYATIYGYTNSSASGCSLGVVNGAFSRPLVQFSQQVPVTTPETVAITSRTWNVSKGQYLSFYNSTNGKVITSLSIPSDDLGCVTASVSKQGNGFISFGAPGGVKKSAKEFMMSAVNDNATAGYIATVYLDSAELGSASLANVRLVKTTATTDAGMNASNTEIATPVVTTYPTYKSFAAKFTGFGRYFLADNIFVLPSTGIGSVNSTQNIRVDNNPFIDRIYLSYNLNNSVKADVYLFDITGKLLYSNKQQLQATEHRFTIDLSNMALSPGNYVLQVVTPTEVLRQKMVKE